MTTKKTEQTDISEKLHEAIDGLRKDVTRVEVWATALSSFSQPIPEYRPNPKFELGQPVETGPMAPEERENASENEPEKGS